MASTAENPILIDEEQEKVNSSRLPATPNSKRPTQTPVLMRSSPFGIRTENVPDYFYRNLFEKFILLLLCMYFKKNYN